ncbi:MAG: hypothetical protein HC915_13155 [Anaerolineae bacterium]|nr:hypothetical protein [Anaerolineae bacterium]
MRKWLWLGVVLLLALIPAASAQQFENPLPIAYGESLSGQAADLSNLMYYRFEGAAGDQITILASSTLTDTYLQLGTPEGTLLAENDDISSSNLNSRIDFTLPSAGAYVISAGGYTPGAFTLELLGPGGPDTRSQFPVIQYGQTLSGQSIDIFSFSYYTFSGTAGDEVTIIASSPTVDTYLQLGTADGNLLAENDDLSITNLDAQITTVLPTTGEYLIGVAGYTPGAYSLSLTGPSTATDVVYTPVSYGQSIAGEVTATGQYTFFTFQGRAGDALSIEVASSAIDPYVVAGTPSGSVLAENDDISREDLNARVEVVLPSSGEYLIGVGGYSPGPFTLTINLSTEGDFLPTSDIATGQVFTGEITDALTYGEYQFEVPTGVTIVADLRATSGDLDTVMALWLGEELLAENDDRAPGDLNSYLEYPNAPPGTYYITVTRYGGEQGATSGTFELVVDLRPSTELPPTVTTSAPNPTANGYPTQEVAQRAEWTVLAYLGADNNLEGALLNDLNEFELAGGSNERVRIVALVDRSPGYDRSNDNWTGSRLFEVGADVSGDHSTWEFPPTIDSVTLADLGDLDSSYGSNLTDFLVWGMTHYPAERYAVALNDHGAGWAGIITDDTARGILTLSELEEAFRMALEVTGEDGFDILFNDACLMSSLEYYAAIAPYFDYVVSSPELTYNPSFDMELLTRTLNQNPAIELGDLGKLMMDKYMQDMGNDLPDLVDVLGATVTDLTRFDTVVAALNEFSRVVTSNPAAHTPVLGQARSNAYVYGFYLPEDEFGPAVFVDPGHFMKLVIEESRDAELRAAAAAVVDALQAVTFYGTAGNHLTRFSTFYNIYFPQRNSDVNQRYFQDTPLQSWQQLLRAYFGEATGGGRFRSATEVSPVPLYSPNALPVPAPQITITNLFPAVASSTTPAIISMEVTGRGIANGDFTVDIRLPDGTLQRLNSTRILTEVVEDGMADLINFWAPGVGRHTLYLGSGNCPT